ncbi:hypothetical protein [Brasilonema sp. UFV-L1]|uniref:hypothetical protein n=1 Tax=Brasilonema sp. UFV-L1 TaxID=2234130 RepID=UPI00145EDD28|nr:hypothetical protein [Brasilonema sp. UFV-L1]NMG09626.1 hypothetical protein [Brasilonema sp. UFV-L1]
MTETSEHTPTEQPSSEELAEVIAEFEEYRERLVSETLATAQKAKVMKATALAQLEPELAKIDAVLQQLRDRASSVTTNH